MSSRTWFYAEGDKQLGPYSEEQFRNFIGRGAVTAATYVWTEGMSGWQRAGEIPGLIPAAAPRPPGPPVMPQAGYVAASAAGASGGSLSIDFGIWDFTWRTLVLVIGSSFIIPAPWLLVWYLKWLVPCIRVPARPNLSFEGTAMTIVPWFFGAFVLLIVVAMTGSALLNNLMILVQLALYWLFLKWLVANLASNGQPLGLSFSGTIWAYLGWTILSVVSIVTIIGWAWVYAAWTRWFCQNIQGTRRAAIFHGTGLEFLWRGLVAVIASSFIIPIPWVYRWMMNWLASQTELVDRTA
jgi:hypothetical protein